MLKQQKGGREGPASSRYRQPKPGQDKSLWVASRQAKSRCKNHIPGALRAEAEAVISEGLCIDRADTQSAARPLNLHMHYAVVLNHKF